MKALELSNYFVERASEIDENDLTNLKLQKLLYFAQGEYLARKGDKLFDDSIEAWELGPVVRDVYDKYKICGSFPITVFDIPNKRVSIDPKVKSFLDNIWDKYGKFSAAYLVNLTHKKETPWAKNFEKGENKTIASTAWPPYQPTKSWSMTISAFAISCSNSWRGNFERILNSYFGYFFCNFLNVFWIIFEPFTTGSLGTCKILIFLVFFLYFFNSSVSRA